jgi:hypothetical protein
MGVYRKIEQQLWTDEKFMHLSPIKPSGQSLWIYLLTGPQVGIIPGLYVAGRAFLAESLGWEPKAFREAFREVLQEGLVQESPKERLIWIPNALKYNMPASPNVIRSWQNFVHTLPECPLFFSAVKSLRATLEAQISLSKTYKSLSGNNKTPEGFLKAFDEVFGEALGKGFEIPSPNTEQEQEQEQEYKSERENETADFDFQNDDLIPPDLEKTPPSIPTPTFGTSLLDQTINQIIDYWNSKGLVKTSHFISVSASRSTVLVYDNACKTRTKDEIEAKIDEYLEALPDIKPEYRYRSFLAFMSKGLDREFKSTKQTIADNPKEDVFLCPTCHVPLKGSGCPVCFTVYGEGGLPV